MELFTFIPYFLLLEREESDRNTLANANTEFIREVYELQRVEKDVTLVFFQLQYLSCKLVILREHYRTAQKEHLPLLCLYHWYAGVPERSAGQMQVHS